MRRVVLGMVAAGLIGAASAGCNGESGATPVAARRAPRQIVVAVDLSASRTPQMLADGRAFLESVVEDLSYGDRLVLLEVSQSGTQAPARRWAAEVPALDDPSFESSRDRSRLEGTKEAALAVVEEFFEAGASAGRTDLLSTLHLAAEYVRDGAGRASTVVLLSDMLQSAHGIEMEGLRRMPDAGWIARQREAGLLPPLQGACVAVVGADPSTPAGSRVRGFWMELFRAAGARIESSDYRIINPEGRLPGCG